MIQNIGVVYGFVDRVMTLNSECYHQEERKIAILLKLRKKKDLSTRCSANITIVMHINRPVIETVPNESVTPPHVHVIGSYLSTFYGHLERVESRQAYMSVCHCCA